MSSWKKEQYNKCHHGRKKGQKHVQGNRDPKEPHRSDVDGK